MRSFRLSTALLLITIVALIFATFVAWRQVALSKDELSQIHRRFGIIRVADSNKTYVRRFVSEDYRVDTPLSGQTESFRIFPADETRYVLHLSEVADCKFAYPSIAGLVPTKTIPLDSWRPGAVVSCQVSREAGVPRVLISADGKLVVDYETTARFSDVASTTWAWPEMGMGTQQEFSPDQSIRLLWWYADNSKRGFMFWLEPYQVWQERGKDRKSDIPSEDDLKAAIAPSTRIIWFGRC